MPESRATCTYARSRIDNTCERIVRVGSIHASEATTRAIISTVTAVRSEVASTTRNSRPGTVSSTSAAPRIKVSHQAAKVPSKETKDNTDTKSHGTGEETNPERQRRTRHHHREQIPSRRVSTEKVLQRRRQIGFCRADAGQIRIDEQGSHRTEG